MPEQKMERFTAQARRVLSLAQLSAEERNHSAIDTEHMLLAIMREEGGVASHVLHDMGLKQDCVVDGITELSQAGQRQPNQAVDISPGTKRALELSVDEARSLGHHFIGTEHLLLALLRVDQNKSTAASIIQRCGINPAVVRMRVLKALQVGPTGEAEAEWKLELENQEHFTQRATRVMDLAAVAAHLMKHHYIGTEHMLLGFIREGSGIAARVLRDLGLEIEKVEELVRQYTAGAISSVEKPLEWSPDTKRVLELAVDEARRMGHHYIATEHLLLGVVRQPNSIAIDILKKLGVSPEEVRRQTRRVLQEKPPPTAAPPLKAALPSPPQIPFKNQVLHVSVSDTDTGAVKFELNITLEQLVATLSTIFDLAENGKEGNAVLDDSAHAQRIEITLKSADDSTQPGSADANE